MHPALRKGPLFTKHTPHFPLLKNTPHFISCLRACFYTSLEASKLFKKLPDFNQSPFGVVYLILA